MSRGLRSALLAIGALIALVLVYPLLNESADSSCSAFEKSRFENRFNKRSAPEGFPIAMLR